MNLKGQLNALTGLRFFAAACIVIYHAHGTFGSAGLAQTFALSQGVSLFFVLSGFILAYRYQSLTNMKDVGRFLLARFARLWPLHLSCTALLILLVPSEINLTQTGRSTVVFLYLFLMQAWIPIKNFVFSLNAVSWSISAEVFFYMCFPVLIYYCRKSKIAVLSATALLALGCVLVGAYFQLPSDENAVGVTLWGMVYTHPMARVLEFTIGIVFFGIYKSLLQYSGRLGTPAYTGLEALCILIAICSMWLTPKIAASNVVISVLGKAGAYWFKGSGSFICFALLILILAFGKGKISQFLGTPLMILLGEISFAMYLVHLILLRYFVNSINPFVQLPTNIVYVAYWGTVFLVSYLLYVSIERPARAFITRIPEMLSGGLNSYGYRQSTDVSLNSRGIKKQVLLFCLLISVVSVMKIGVPNYFYSKSNSLEVLSASAWDVNRQSEAVFGDEFELLQVMVKPVDKENYEASFIWRAQRDTKLRYKVGMHLIDEKNQILTGYSYEQSPRKVSVEKGRVWRERVVVSVKDFEKASGFGLAIFERPDAMHFLLPVRNAQTDWDGRRLIIKNLTVSN